MGGDGNKRITPSLIVKNSTATVVKTFKRENFNDKKAIPRYTKIYLKVSENYFSVGAKKSLVYIMHEKYNKEDQTTRTQCHLIHNGAKVVGDEKGKRIS